MAYDVFISYSSRDKPIADGVCANLEAAGVRCWIAPRDIQAGREWPTEISNAIPQCRAMVLIFSTHSNNSNDVSRELVLAASNKLFIIPFKIDDVAPKPGMNYYLASTHWLDAMNPPTHEQIQVLVATVKNLLGLESLAPAPFIPILPAEREKATQSPKKKTLTSRLLWIGIPLLVILAVVACAGSIYLGKKLFPGMANVLTPTQVHFSTASAPGLGLAQVTATTGLLPAWTATLPALTPAPGAPNVTITSAPIPTAAGNSSALNIHATPGKILDLNGNCVAYSPDGKWLIIGSDQIYFYDPHSLTQIRSIQGSSGVSGLAISPDSKVLAAIDESRGVVLFDLASGSELRTLDRTTISTGAVSSSFLAFAPDSQTLAVILGDTVKLFDVASGNEKGTLVAKDARAILFSADGKSLFATGIDGIGVWDVTTSTQLRTLGEPSMTFSRLALSPDGSLLVSGNLFDEPMVLWNAATGQQVRSFAGHKGGINSLAFSPDGKLLASSAGDVTIKLWDVATGNLLQTLTGPTEAVSSLSISPDGSTLASIGNNQGVWLWGVAGK
jgi:WD40 repeat protein